MIVKKNKVIVIDKKDQDKYMKQGWTLAEESKLDETGHTDVASAMNNVKVAMSALTKMSGELAKLSPEDALPSWWTNKVAIAVDKLDGMADYLDTQVEEAKLIDKPTGKEVKEKLDKDDEDSVGDVVKQLKKAVKAHQGQVKSLTKDMQDELQVKEWFKAKNIDVKVRELEESTQVYVPIGRRIPNEIREELITTQYGKMPEDVKNVKDINYGNFMENSITMNNDFWSKVLHGTKGE